MANSMSSSSPASPSISGQNHRSMAVENTIAVLEAIHRQDLVSQKQIVDGTGLKPSTVSNIIRELKASGIVRGGSALETSGVGAKQISLQIDPTFVWVASWHIDHMGSRLCILDAAGHLMASENFPPDLTWDAIIPDLYRRITTLGEQKRLSMKRFVGIGISIPGIVNREQSEVVCSHPLQMTSVPLRELLAPTFPADKIILVERDIPCGTYLEQQTNPTYRKSSFLYYLLRRRHEDFFEHGPGNVVDGRLFRGSHFAAGELNESLFPRPRLRDIKSEKQWDTLYRQFAKSLAMLGDFLDVDGVIISSDDPGLTTKRFQLLETEILSNFRDIPGRALWVTRSQSGPDGILAGAGLMVLHRYFRDFTQTLPNRSLQSLKAAKAK